MASTVFQIVADKRQFKTDKVGHLASEKLLFFTITTKNLT